MGTRGPAKKPTALALLHGDDKQNPQRINREEPTPVPDEPIKPEHLSDQQSAIWDRVVIDLRAMKLLYRADVSLLTQYVVAEELADKLRIRVTNEPVMVRNPVNGSPMPNPIHDKWIKAVTKLEQLARIFGLSPSARASIRLTAAQPDSDKAKTPDRLFG